MSFEDLILNCAERWGKADQSGSVPALPTNEADLALIKRKINDGYRAFLASNPKWRFAEQDVTILFYPNGDGPLNIEADAGRYRMPEFIGSTPLGDWTFAGDSTPRSRVVTMDYDIVRKHLDIGGSSTGVPCYAGVGPMKSTDKEQPRIWEAVFFPRPSQTWTCSARFRVTSHKLVNLTDRHIAGGEHDETLIRFCDWEWFGDDAEDQSISDKYAGRRNEALMRSIALDREMSGRRHGKVTNLGNGQPDAWKRPLGSITYDGVPI